MRAAETARLHLPLTLAPSLPFSWVWRISAFPKKPETSPHLSFCLPSHRRTYLLSLSSFFAWYLIKIETFWRIWWVFGKVSIGLTEGKREGALMAVRVSSKIWRDYLYNKVKSGGFGATRHWSSAAQTPTAPPPKKIPHSSKKVLSLSLSLYTHTLGVFFFSFLDFI